MPTPICIFAFNRPHHLQRTLAALAANELAAESALTIFCDGPRYCDEADLVVETRTVAASARGFASVRVVEREQNLGLAGSVVRGVSEMLALNNTVVVLEDDLVTSPYFLRYMNDGLELYAEAENVASIHGWCFPHAVKDTPETFFLRGTDCLGWGTWKRAWALFEPDAQRLLGELRQRKLQYAFNCNGTYDYIGMLKAVRSRKISSWAVRWRASAFLHNMYTLHPGRSLVQHTGNDGQGTNVGVTNIFDVPLAQEPVCVRYQPVEENAKMRVADMLFHQRFCSPPPTLLHRLKNWLFSFVPTSRIKTLITLWVPPVFLQIIRRIRKKGHEQTLRWEGDFPDWQSAVAASSGYDQQAIFEKVRDAARVVRDGRALWERDSVLFYHEEYNWPLVASLMTVAARNKGRLTVLDFGGALGSTFRQNRALLDGLPFLSWNIVEQAHVVACGQEEFVDDILTFWPDMDSCVEASPPDVILFSSVLQYLENPYALLQQAVAYGPQAIIIERTPFAEKGERITVQHVPAEIYEASYPCRWLDRGRVDRILESGYRSLPSYTTHIDPPGFYGFVAVRKE